MLNLHGDGQVRELRTACSATQLLERLVEALARFEIPDRALEFAGEGLVAVVRRVAQRP